MATVEMVLVRNTNSGVVGKVPVKSLDFWLGRGYELVEPGEGGGGDPDPEQPPSVVARVSALELAIATKVGLTGIDEVLAGLADLDSGSALADQLQAFLDAGLDGKLDVTEKGSSNGLATLDEDGKVQEEQVPDRLSAAELLASAALGVGAVFEVSDIAPTDTERHGVPVIWADPQHAPVVTINSLTSTGLVATVAWSTTDADVADALVHTVRWGDGSADLVNTASPQSHTYPTGGTYTVTVFTSDGVLIGSDSEAETVSDITAPTAPTALSGGPTATSMVLTWTAATDNVGVTAYRVSKDNGATWITSSVTGTTYTVTGLTASTSYTFAVQARDAAGNWSPSATHTHSTAAAVDYTTAVTADAPTTYLRLNGSAANTGSVSETYTATGLTYSTGLGDGAQAGVFATVSGSKLNAPQGTNAGVGGCTSLTFECIVNPTDALGDFWYYQLGTLSLGTNSVRVLSATLSTTTGNITIVGPTLTASVTIHAALRWDGSNAQWYINGAAYGSPVSTPGSPVLQNFSTAAPRIGDNSAGTGEFNGKLAGVAIYRNNALSASRLLAHAQGAGLA